MVAPRQAFALGLITVIVSAACSTAGGTSRMNGGASTAPATAASTSDLPRVPASTVPRLLDTSAGGSERRMVIAGDWSSPSDGVIQTDPAELQIDHVVALKEAWDSGAWAWATAQCPDLAIGAWPAAPANDVLVETTTATNRQLAPTGTDCDPAYPTVCIESRPPDLDCTDIPYRRFVVRSPDPQHLDGGTKNGIGCESG